MKCERGAESVLERKRGASTVDIDIKDEKTSNAKEQEAERKSTSNAKNHQ